MLTYYTKLTSIWSFRIFFPLAFFSSLLNRFAFRRRTKRSYLNWSFGTKQRKKPFNKNKCDRISTKFILFYTSKNAAFLCSAAAIAMIAWYLFSGCARVTEKTTTFEACKKNKAEWKWNKIKIDFIVQTERLLIKEKAMILDSASFFRLRNCEKRGKHSDI